ncbi:TPA: adhesin, partial [Haemophilus influenzae]
MEPQPSINRLEKAIVDKNYEVACSELLNILEKIDGNFGGINEIEFDFPEQISDLLEKRTQYFCTRVANAVTNLFIDPNLILSESGALRFIAFQRWLAFIFASSPYVNADHILKTYNTNSDILGD